MDDAIRVSTRFPNGVAEPDQRAGDVRCRLCGAVLPADKVAFGSKATGWEHPFGCPADTPPSGDDVSSQPSADVPDPLGPESG